MIHEDFTSEHEAYSTEPVALALAMEAGAQWETNAVSKNSDKVTPRANPKQQAAFANLVSMIPDLASQISGSGHPDEKDAKAMTDAFKLIHSGGSPSENQTGIVIDFLNAKLTNSPYQAHEVYDWNEDLEGGPAVSKHLEIREKSSGKITFSTKWGEGWEQLLNGTDNYGFNLDAKQLAIGLNEDGYISRFGEKLLQELQFQATSKGIPKATLLDAINTHLAKLNSPYELKLITQGGGGHILPYTERLELIKKKSAPGTKE